MVLQNGDILEPESEEEENTIKIEEKKEIKKTTKKKKVKKVAKKVAKKAKKDE